MLHHIPWPRGSLTYREIYTLYYCDYVTRKYGQAIVIFDGYLAQSTKHMTHQRRAAGKRGPEVAFTDIFLGNINNIQKLINMLRRYPSFLDARPIIPRKMLTCLLFRPRSVRQTRRTQSLLEKIHI